MFLKFIGCGSALNTSLGNNSAFIKEGKSLLLIDCGSTTFSRMQDLSLLDDINNIYVLITHRHPDHISSLGDLIFYASYILKTRITILTPEKNNVIKLLEYMGVEQNLYNIVRLTKQYQLKNEDFDIGISFVRVSHVDYLECYGYILDYCNIRIYYSGDANDIPKAVLQDFYDNKLDYVYHDVCSYEYTNNLHMYINKLCTFFSKEDRNRVFCMHYDEDFDKNKALELGFMLVNNFSTA